MQQLTETSTFLESSNLLDIPFSERFKVLPGIFGIRLSEEPEYYIIRTDGDKQVRKYGMQTLASVTVPVLRGQRQQAEDSAFNSLASYIFGQNSEHEHISMTAPVVKEEFEGALNLSFILPNKYVHLAVPQPTDLRILLHHKPQHMVATLEYSGQSDPAQEQIKTNQLKKWLGQYRSYQAVSDAQVVQYDSPMTLNFLRKNEIHIEIKSVH